MISKQILLLTVVAMAMIVPVIAAEADPDKNTSSKNLYRKNPTVIG